MLLLLLVIVPHFPGFELPQTEIRDLQNPFGVDEAVAGFQVAMENNFAVMQIYHAFDEIADQGGNEHIVQSIIAVTQDIVKTATCTKLGQYGNVPTLHTGAKKRHQIFVSKFSHL